MNRAERRKLLKQGLLAPKDPMINLKASDINRIKNKATAEAVNTSFALMLSIPVLVLDHDYPKLMRREVDGKSRAERFAELCMEAYEEFEKGNVSLDDLQTELEKRTGIQLRKER